MNKDLEMFEEMDEETFNNLFIERLESPPGTREYFYEDGEPVLGHDFMRACFVERILNNEELEEEFKEWLKENRMTTRISK